MKKERILNKLSGGKNLLGVEVVSRLYILGKDQTWLATQCGCSKQHISQIVHGKCKPGPAITEKIADALEMSVVEVRMLVLHSVA